MSRHRGGKRETVVGPGPWGHLSVSGDIFGCHWWVEASMCSNVQDTPHISEFSGLRVNSSEAEKL